MFNSQNSTRKERSFEIVSLSISLAIGSFFIVYIIISTLVLVLCPYKTIWIWIYGRKFIKDTKPQSSVQHANCWPNYLFCFA